MLDSYNQKLTIDEFIEMREQEQNMEELSLNPVQSEDEMTVWKLTVMKLSGLMQSLSLERLEHNDLTKFIWGTLRTPHELLRYVSLLEASEIGLAPLLYKIVFEYGFQEKPSNSTKRSRNSDRNENLERLPSTSTESYRSISPLLQETPRMMTDEPKDLNLPSTIDTSRPVTPQDTTCRKRLALAEESKNMKIALTKTTFTSFLSHTTQEPH
ncbi:hypothetical protein TNCV_1794471 [Trichonephila clavipes]|nr:hypothetical protein TNCV_1794471 [Trichonephila clavipes]